MPPIVARTIATLRRSVASASSVCSALRRTATAIASGRERRALRDSAAFALSCCWAHGGEGWSLVLFRDGQGNARHVACEGPDGTWLDARGACSEALIGRRVGAQVTASRCEECEAQALLGDDAALLESADVLRRHIDRHGTWPGSGGRSS